MLFHFGKFSISKKKKMQDKSIRWDVLLEKNVLEKVNKQNGGDLCKENEMIAMSIFTMHVLTSIYLYMFYNGGSLRIFNVKMWLIFV